MMVSVFDQASCEQLLQRVGEHLRGHHPELPACNSTPEKADADVPDYASYDDMIRDVKERFGKLQPTLAKWDAGLEKVSPNFPGADGNRAWLESHPDHALYFHWALLHNYSDEFAEMDSQVTASRLAEEFSGKPLEEWRATTGFCAPLVVFEADDHWVVVRDNIIYHSLYQCHSHPTLKPFKPRREPFYSHLISAITGVVDIPRFVGQRAVAHSAPLSGTVRYYIP